MFYKTGGMHRIATGETGTPSGETATESCSQRPSGRRAVQPHENC